MTILRNKMNANMKRIWTLMAAVFVASASVLGQETGSPENWLGKIVIGGRDLHIGFSIVASSEGGKTCTMDVPEQGAKNIPVRLAKDDADSLCIDIPALRAGYKGRKVSPERIEGVFTQNGLDLALDLGPGRLEQRRPQTPVPPFAYRTEEIIFVNEVEGASLSGTLIYPAGFDSAAEGTVPVVLMVTGSGGQDRNEEVFGHKPFLVIADFLARHGIASLRYDDRGVGQSTGPIQGTTTLNNLADAEAGIAWLRGSGKFGKVGVLGHSEGGTVAFMMGADRSVDFLISLAGTAVSGIDVIVGQNEAVMMQQGLPQALVQDYSTALRVLYKDRVERKEVADPVQYVEALCRENGLALPEAFKDNLVRCITAGDEWLTWFLGYDPATAIREIACPVMALNGNLDLQVLSKDNLPVIRENLPENDKHLIWEYESLNHLFQHCTIETALDYGAIEETLSEEVLNDLARWIRTLE